MSKRGAELPVIDDEGQRLLPFVGSKVFATLFAQGMELVEETATYLDNGGRRASKKLERSAAMTYAGVSMRLTTRLMQIASWLLVLRAVRDGEMSEDEARDAKYRIGNSSKDDPATDMSELPETLRELVGEADTLFARISRLDHDLFVAEGASSLSGDAKSQLEVLQRAFSS